MTEARTAAALPILDDLDWRILDQLQKDASLTNQELARVVHSSPPTCLRRVRRLVQLGIIERQVAVLNPARLGAHLLAILEVTLDRQAAEDQQAFEDAMVPLAEVQQCYRVSPGPDFVLVLQVAGMAEYHHFSHHHLTARNNVRNVRSFFSVRRGKFSTALPLREGKAD